MTELETIGLETLIDGPGLQAVVAALVKVCDRRVDTLVKQQDCKSAKRWGRAAMLLSVVAGEVDGL
jgi:hypothetical protein